MLPIVFASYLKKMTQFELIEAKSTKKKIGEEKDIKMAKNKVNQP